MYAYAAAETAQKAAAGLRVGLAGLCDAPSSSHSAENKSLAKPASSPVVASAAHAAPQRASRSDPASPADGARSSAEALRQQLSADSSRELLDFMQSLAEQESAHSIAALAPYELAAVCSPLTAPQPLGSETMAGQDGSRNGAPLSQQAMAMIPQQLFSSQLPPQLLPSPNAAAAADAECPRDYDTLLRNELAASQSAIHTLQARLSAALVDAEHSNSLAAHAEARAAGMEEALYIAESAVSDAGDEMMELRAALGAAVDERDAARVQAERAQRGALDTISALQQRDVAASRSGAAAAATAHALELDLLRQELEAVTQARDAALRAQDEEQRALREAWGTIAALRKERLEAVAAAAAFDDSEAARHGADGRAAPGARARFPSTAVLPVLGVILRGGGAALTSPHSASGGAGGGSPAAAPWGLARDSPRSAVLDVPDTGDGGNGSGSSGVTGAREETVTRAALAGADLPSPREAARAHPLHQRREHAAQPLLPPGEPDPEGLRLSLLHLAAEADARIAEESRTREAAVAEAGELRQRVASLQAQRDELAATLRLATSALRRSSGGPSSRGGSRTDAPAEVEHGGLDAVAGRSRRSSWQPLVEGASPVDVVRGVEAVGVVLGERSEGGTPGGGEGGTPGRSEGGTSSSETASSRVATIDALLAKIRRKVVS